MCSYTQITLELCHQSYISLLVARRPHAGSLACISRILHRVRVAGGTRAGSNSGDGSRRLCGQATAVCWMGSHWRV